MNMSHRNIRPEEPTRRLPGSREGTSKDDLQELITGGTGESCSADGDVYRGVGRAVGVSRQKGLGRARIPIQSRQRDAQCETLGGL